MEEMVEEDEMVWLGLLKGEGNERVTCGRRCIKYLQRQSSPTGVELAEDGFVLHVEGTARTQRVVRHIGQTSWPGRLTLTNQALYFEASKAVSYEDALKLDLSRPDVDHRVNAGSTGPWGAPLFDKAMIFESSQLSEPVVLEFPELTGSTRRDHWLALTKEVIFLHRFLLKFQIEPPLRAWEVQARTMLGIFRLHAAREMLRISPPVPSSFLIFYLFDELPKGDYVLEELSNSLGGTDAMHPCSATLILKRLNISHRVVEDAEVKEGLEGPAGGVAESLVSLETTIGQVREEAKELIVAKASVEGLKEEGLAYSLLILMELLSPLNQVFPWLQRILSWENPLITLVRMDRMRPRYIFTSRSRSDVTGKAQEDGRGMQGNCGEHLFREDDNGEHRLSPARSE
ncbi:hypothetical protein QJS10_CPA08g00085 [Acorus calamus]|uniref:Uncharacterized protein n=1 Tax=Acorus calamus TaxID=4465 RepID=A0AAV9EAA6_ACOCL|nr:hypothetical protein QJS10_CPA08g00085 [Acorus calamus]